MNAKDTLGHDVPGPTAAEQNRKKRFRVALSFPGEHREFVSQVAEHLAADLGRDNVFYDNYNKAELSRPNLDTYLQKIYHDDSELLVVFLCEAYEEKEWCGIEWRAIRDLIKQRKDAEIMPIRLDNGDVSGLFSIDGYLDAANRSPADTASLILERLRINDAARAPQPSSETDSSSTGPALQLPRVAPSRLPKTSEFLVGRSVETGRLDEAWKNPGTNLVSIVAPGGVGKTQLIKRWRETMAKEDFRGATRVFDWSFYSQGTKDAAASADIFVIEALKWFGETDPDSYTSAWAKGARIAELVKESRTLLILDGLEPLQHPPGPMHGDLTDQAVEALLKGLCESNPGLCVITTRAEVADLSDRTEPG